MRTLRWLRKGEEREKRAPSTMGSNVSVTTWEQNQLPNGQTIYLSDCLWPINSRRNFKKGTQNTDKLVFFLSSSIVYLERSVLSCSRWANLHRSKLVVAVVVEKDCIELTFHLKTTWISLPFKAPPTKLVKGVNGKAKAIGRSRGILFEKKSLLLTEYLLKHIVKFA